MDSPESMKKLKTKEKRSRNWLQIISIKFNVILIVSSLKNKNPVLYAI